MEDIQDGIMKSIQDGVEEDPTVEEKLLITGKSFMGLISIQSEISNPQIITIHQETTDSQQNTITITVPFTTQVV